LGKKIRIWLLALAVAVGWFAFASRCAIADELPAEGPRLGSQRITQADVTSGKVSLRDIRRAGLRIFTTPFNKADGYGDGSINPGASTRFEGNRPTLNGAFLRVNGLDAQTCLECHSLIDASTIPPTLGIGGAGGSVTNAIALPSRIELEAPDLGTGLVPFNGRFINPPALHGAGAVELVAREMTEALQAIADEARAHAGTLYLLTAKGVDFGTIIADGSGELDTTGVTGVDDDLIVKPFGRKGEFATTRDFDRAAMLFHFGMQPVEVVGPDIDSDGDGVVNEILLGELSALQVFTTTLRRPYQVREGNPDIRRGRQVFVAIGCASCHVPEMRTDHSVLEYYIPGDDTPYYAVDLLRDVSGYDRAPGGGIRVPMFSDLKRHDLGPELAENLDLVGNKVNQEFITPRLWGVAGTAPYMHSGQATTIGEAITMHGGEASTVRGNYFALPELDRRALHAMLQTLRLPVDAEKGLVVK
jgi:hypothetical protein